MTDYVSIITPMYNAETTIIKTIESVVAQTYPKWELIIINDLSTDRSVEKVLLYLGKDDRVKLLHMPKNSGVAATRNFGIQNSKGRYMAFLDSDDWWMPEKLELQVKFIRAEKAGLVYSSYCRVDGHTGENKYVSVPEKLTYSQLLKGNQIACLTVMVDREETGNFQMEKIRHEDYAAWLSLARNGIVMRGLNKPLAFYRVMGNSLSGNKLKSAIWTWNIYRNHEKLSVFQSIKCFIHYILQGIQKQ